MKIKFLSTHKETVSAFTLEALDGAQFELVNDTEIEIPEGWYCLRINYNNHHCEIHEMHVNDVDVKQLIYTGYFVSIEENKIYQPATAVWRPGYFELWIHTNLGVWQKTVFEQIKNDHYGTNLFENYKLTVDRPLQIQDHFPTNIKALFAHGDGPVWWRKNSVEYPYEQLDIEITDEILQALSSLEEKLPHNKTRGGWVDRMTETTTDNADPQPLSDLQCPVLENLLKQAGYTHFLSYSILSLAPGTFIDVHIDDHPKAKNLQYIKGCQKFYLNYGQLNEVYFKLGSAGILPLEKPLRLNTTDHAHAVVNQSACLRKVFMVYGVLDKHNL